MNKAQLYSAVFDCACFLLAHMDLYDAKTINLNDLRHTLRLIIQDSSYAKVLAVEEELGLKDSADELKKS